MRLTKCLALFISFCILVPTAFATMIYRHIPFHAIVIKVADKVIVNYDFSEKNGIRCTSDSNKIAVDFTYKGRQKTSYLPVVLQSSHVPNQTSEREHEELADVEGQFSLFIDKNISPANEFTVNCTYSE